jgi:transposase
MKNNDSGSIALKPNQIQRLHFLQMVTDGYLSLQEASRKMGLSYRQAKRLKKAFTHRGFQGIVHGNTGRKSHRAFSAEITTKIIHLARTRYSALSDIRIMEKVRSELGIAISRETVRKLLRASGVKNGRPRSPLSRLNAHASSGQEGAMVLWGGITGAWFPALPGTCRFMAAIDVATLKCLAARFFQAESNEGYLWLLRKVLLACGMPGAFCQHSQNAVLRRDKVWTIDEQLRGERDPTQVGRALRLLGIPQYLESRRRVASITSLFSEFLQEEFSGTAALTLQQANRLLEKKLIKLFNRRFRIAGSGAEKAWRPLPRSLDVERVCSFHYDASVLYNNKVILGDIEIDIPPGQKRISYAKVPVEVRQLLDGSWRVYYHDEIIATHGPTPVREPAVAKGMKGHSLNLPSALWVYELYAQGDMAE